VVEYTVSCFIWVWNLVPHITKEQWLGKVKHKGAEEDTVA
jgi:hypothetical protein